MDVNSDLNLSNLNLGSDEDEDSTMPASMEESALVSNYEYCLVGSFLTIVVINFVAMKNTLASYWRPPKGIDISELGAHRFLFWFYHEVDVSRVMAGGPYNFNNHQLVLYRLKNNENLLHVPLLYIDMWVQVHDLLPGMFSEAMAKMLGIFIGKFVAYDAKNVTVSQNRDICELE